MTRQMAGAVRRFCYWRAECRRSVTVSPTTEVSHRLFLHARCPRRSHVRVRGVPEVDANVRNQEIGSAVQWIGSKRDPKASRFA